MKFPSLRWLPLAILLLISALFGWGLTRPQSAPVRSQIVGSALPAIWLAPATSEGGAFLLSTAINKPRLVNLFASWCIPCRAEAPQLEALARAGVHIDGIAVRDRPEDVERFLAETGNPYARIGGDPQSELMLAFGSVGVPETFIIDRQGIVVAQIQGVITNAMVPQIVAELERLR
jgi:cytochrome c biogenesis protein CcmG, thiol:disulfide interchange protein DsbE